MSDERTPHRQTPPPGPPPGPTPEGARPDTRPAAKEEIATDLSEVARARVSGSDKTQEIPSVAADAADAAKGVAGTPADDDTAAEVEAAPTAVLGKDAPGPKVRGEVGADAPTPAPPSGAAGTPPPMTSTGGGSTAAPAETKPAGTGAPTLPPAPQTAAPAAPPAPAAGGNGAAARPADGKPAPGAQPASAGGPVANPDTTAKSPTAADAAPTSASAGAAASGQNVTDAGTPTGTPARPAGAAPAGARPAAAAGAKPAAKPAAPPKPPEPDPDEVTALRGLVPDLTWERRHGYLEIKIPSGQLIPVARQVKSLGYNYLSAVTAVDWRDRVELLYHCYGWDYVEMPGCVVLRADLPNEPNPLCPSLTGVWAGAEFQEREIYDLFGVKFIGHPDLRRVLLDDNFPGHPLRKDWTFDYEYVLVRHLKYGAEGQDLPPGGGEGFRRV